MGHKDDLKFEVTVVQRNGVSTFECLASFSAYFWAMQFMDRELTGITKYAFDSEFNEKDVIVELYYSTPSRLQYVLFRHPSVNLPSMNDLPERTTKEKLAKRLSLGRSFDYALPHDWLKYVVNSLAELDYDEPQALHQKLSYGTVWFYPSEGVGRVSGRPVALTSDAEELLIAFVEEKGDE